MERQQKQGSVGKQGGAIIGDQQSRYQRSECLEESSIA